MRAELEVVKGSPRQVVRLQPGESATIGRSKGADLRIDSNLISRLHCRVHHDGKGWVLTDLESRNGTWVDALRIQSHRLEEGTVFTLGKQIAIRFNLLEKTGEMAGGQPGESAGTCAFCLTPLAPGDGVPDGEGHVYHGGCRSLSRLVGAELSGVRIIERLPGQGGTSHRLRAHQPSLNRHVLLHAFDEGTVGAGDFRARLLDEVRAISRLLHPNLLQIHDLIDHKGSILVVMEFLSNTTLADVLARRKFVNVTGALHIASQIADAMAYAQEQDVVFDRLSPADVQVNDENEAKVMLFQSPAAVRPSPAEIAYVAPEVIKGGGLRRTVRRVDPEKKGAALRGAVYSVGAMLYHMLSGIPPFEAPTEEQLLPKIMTDVPPALRRVNLKVSPALARIVERAMDKDPGNRPPDFRALKVDLRKIMAPGL